MKILPLVCVIALTVMSLVIFSSSWADEPKNSLGLQELRTDEEFQQYVNNLTSRYQSVGYDGAQNYAKDSSSGPVSLPVLGAMKSASVRQEAAPTSLAESKGGASEYSTTNVQVAGVDEADFVKNDGKYIYIVSGNTVSIVQAYPPQTSTIVSQMTIPGSVSDLFLTQDRLVVFTVQYGHSPVVMRKEDLFEPQSIGPVSGERTSALVYDISDRTHPEKIREISAPGRYDNARMIGEYVYFLTDENQYWNPRMPFILDDAREIRTNSVWCPPTITGETRMNTLTSFPVTGNGVPEAISFLLGWDTTLYVSSTDVFVAYQKDRYDWNIPVGEVTTGQGNDEQRQISVIHRFGINRGSIEYKATGTVPGYLLNQFSLDQYEGNLRVATTSDDWSSSKGKSSNVYVLDPDLITIGKVEGLAPGEKIYSARFMEDLLYLVTFKQTDPLFVIDLSNPTHPGILGELKIPGYSDYLHPYDRTHLIGIGKDTYENSGGGVIPTGIKIALFDVSDLNNPRLVDSRVIGEKGSDSAVLTDHRAFLFDKAKNMMVLPIKEVVHTPVIRSRYEGSYTEEIWQGAYVFGIDPVKGFAEIGRVHHGSGSNDESWESGSTIKRSIFMDSILYTISHDTIQGSDLKDLSSRLMKIDLSNTPEKPWYLKPFWSSLLE